MLNRKVRWAVIATCIVATLALGHTFVKGQQTTLTWMMYGDAEQARVYEALAADFESIHPDYRIRLLPMIGVAGYRDRLFTYYAAGAAPDVFLTFAQHRDAFIAQNMLYDVTDLFDASSLVSRDMYYPAIRDVFEVGGRVWGTPWGYNAKLFLINSDLREQRGVPSPDPNWTVDDFRDYARKLNSPQNGIVATDAVYSLEPTATLGWMYNYTGHYWIDAATNEVHVDDPGMLDMLNFWLELQDTYEAASGYALQRPPGGTRGGMIATYETWSTEPHYLSIMSDATQWDWELATFPAGPVNNSHFAQGHLWTIPANHPNPEAAWKFVEYLGSERAEELWATTQRTPPQVHRPDLWELYFADVPQPKQHDAISFILNELYASGRAKSMVYWPSYPDMEPYMQATIQSVMMGAQPPEAALSNLARAFRAMLDD